nr:unnamed protein product [Digitaria exilis]
MEEDEETASFFPAHERVEVFGSYRSVPFPLPAGSDDMSPR